MGKSKADTEAKRDKGETVDEILAAAKKAKYDMLAFARGAQRSLAAVRSARYEWNRSTSTVDGIFIHYFRTPGETLTGIIGPAEYESWKGVSYKMILDDGTVTRLPGNRQLNKLIENTKCLHLRVRIEYLGKRYLTTRHYEKCYAIHPAPLSETSIMDTPQGRETMQKLGKLHQVATKRSPKVAARTPEERKEARRKFVKNMVAAGHTFKRATLKEFKGESWADAALETAKKEASK